MPTTSFRRVNVANVKSLLLVNYRVDVRLRLSLLRWITLENRQKAD